MQVRERWQAAQIFRWVTMELRIEQESRVLDSQAKDGNAADSQKWRGRTTWRGYGGGSRVQGTTVEEVRKDVSTPTTGGHGTAGSNAATAGRASSRGGRGRSQSRDRSCWTCRQAGRPANHNWLGCQWAREQYRRRMGKEAPAPRPPEGVGRPPPQPRSANRGAIIGGVGPSEAGWTPTMLGHGDSRQSEEEAGAESSCRDIWG